MSKILVIEDDTFLQTLEVGKLKKDNHEILSAASGEDAMKKIMIPNIDLILLDLVLPNFDGFEILKKVREIDSTKNVPVIVFSNLSEESDVKKAKDLGANDFMVKSNFTLDELMDRIRLVLKK